MPIKKNTAEMLKMRTRKEFLEKKAFVRDYLSPCLHAANPNLTCEFCIGAEIEPKPGEARMHRFPAEDEFVVVTSDNGHRYFVNVSGNSLPAIAKEVFDAMASK